MQYLGEILRNAKPVLILLGISAALVIGITMMMQYFIEGAPAEIELTNEDSLDQLDILTPEVRDDYQADISSNMNPIAVLNTNRGVIEIELYEDFMPITAGNFMKLAEENFYDEVKFHRVIEGFMIQAGDPITKTDQVMRYGTGGPGYSIPDEHVQGDNLTNVRGTISMANSGPDSGGSQFFINLADNTNLDYDKTPLTSKHPVFGRVINGMDVVDSISIVETNSTALPLEDIVIESVEIRR